ncbi:MAG: molybdopterin-guanine dinucleotide biosynthesis protein B [Alphaproteobacteria bacterium]|nr:molybdopterin-guanine dinucleotide biosynthesis protein B [Alphaproteobacteria bacterium]MBM3732966.1 molybdopterin-guanine dinucleotide biosynthesis protein B [Acidimicrobiia bacterium]
MKVFGLAGWSGSGKTTLVVKLLPELIGRGFSVSTIKHTHHSFDIDKPGKDSYEHRLAGANEVMISSSVRWALLHELRGEPEPDLKALIARMKPVDILLVEGFKAYPHPKLEIHRPALGKPLLCLNDPHVVAVASDALPPDLPVPGFALDDVAGIVDHILATLRLEAPVRHGAA